MNVLTIKSVKISRSLSEDTLAFTATVYKNNKRVGNAKSAGHGGPVEFIPVKGFDEKKEFEGLAKSFIEKYESASPKFPGLYNKINDASAIEHAINHLAHSKDCLTEINKLKRQHYAFDPDEDVCWKIAKKNMSESAFRSNIIKQCKGAVFVADLSDAAIAHYLKHENYLTEYGY